MPKGLFLCILCLCIAPAATAKHIYQYTDANGIVHYTDVKPGEDVADVKSTLVRTDHQPLVQLREDGTEADRLLTFVNAAGGPVSIDITVDRSTNSQSDPPLPARLVLAATSETHAVRVTPINPHAGFSYSFRYAYMPGDFRAQADPKARYHLPFPADRQFRVAQAFAGKASHTDAQNHYAVDIGMPEGTPVLAAREGVVMTLDNDFYGAGLDMARYGDRANNIRIVHADGTMAVYAHLQLESARVRVGQRVRAGQVLALSGDTGYTSGAHLHFCVQINSNMQLISVPFQFTGPQGDFTPTVDTLIGGQ
jgi:murein DD-endopeptidase MepM/ murein hydrolase activator NlpD